MIWVKTQAAIQLRPVIMDFGYILKLTPVSDYQLTNMVLVPPTYELSPIVSQNQILAVGCQKWHDGKGEIQFIDPSSLKVVYKLKGDSEHKEVGKRIVYVPGTGYSEVFWYTSQLGSKVSFNTITFYKQSNSEEW